MLISITGCGKGTPGPDDGGVQTPPRLGIGGTDVNYLWDDDACASGSAMGTKLAAATISSWSESTRRDITVSLGDLVDASGRLNTKNIANKISSRAQFSRDCSNVRNGQCLDTSGKEPGFTLVTEGQEPRFCRPEGNYTVDSIERVTLTSALYLRNAVKFATDTYKDNGTLAAIQLLVLPQFASKVPTSGLAQTNVLVNNLAYFPVKNTGVPYIAVLPRQLNASDTVPRLWESEFVFAHEFGHHIERRLQVDRFFEANVSVVRSAASEAFADLNAYASAGLTDSTIRNIPCIGADRAVGIGSFRDGVAKIFSKDEVLAVEANDRKDNALVGFEFQADSCPTVIKYESHGIGAILAYNVSTMIGLALDAVKTSSTSRSKTFALTAAQWIKDLDQRITKGSNNPRNDIIAAGRALENTVKDVFSKAGIPISTNIADALCGRMAIGFGGTGEQTWFGRDCAKQTNLTAQD